MESRVPLAPPKVIRWFRVYCWAGAAIAALSLVLGGVLYRVASLGLISVSNDGTAFSSMPLVTHGGVMAAASLFLCVMFIAGALHKRNPRAWIYGLILIAAGIATVCALPVAALLLAKWLNPETRAWYQNA